MYIFTNFKKEFLLLLFILGSVPFHLIAQPTFTEAYITNMLNQPQRIVQYETNLNISNQLSDILTATGPNQIYDFRNLNYVDSTVTIEEFVPVSSSDPFASHPNLVGSDLIWKTIIFPVQGGLPDTTFNYQYGNLNNGSWTVRGSVSIFDLDFDGTTDTIVQWFSPPTLQIQFPINTTTIWTDSTSLVQNFQGMVFTSSIFIDTNQVTGWGTLHTPAISAPALRLDQKLITKTPFTMMSDVGRDISFVTAESQAASIVVDDGRAFYRTVTPLSPTTSTKDIRFSIPPFQLKQNYPNPVKTQTTISFSLDRSQNATIRILDMSGKERVVIANRRFQTGEHVMEWRNVELESGIFILEMRVGNQVQQQKLIVQK